MAEVSIVKFCTLWDYIKSCQRDDKSLTKRVSFGSCDNFCMHNCGLRKFCQGMPLSEVFHTVVQSSYWQDFKHGHDSWASYMHLLAKATSIFRWKKVFFIFIVFADSAEALASWGGIIKVCCVFVSFMLTRCINYSAFVDHYGSVYCHNIQGMWKTTHSYACFFHCSGWKW